jgi:hypothetical protein
MKENIRTARQTIFKTTLWFFFAGVLIAITLETLWRMVGYYSPNGYILERIARVLWPSSVFKMVLEDRKGPTSHVAVIYALSFVANGALYGLLGVLVGLAKNAFKPPQ